MTSKHTCGQVEMRVSRMLLALLSDDRDMYEVVIREIDGCSLCWQAISHWVLAQVAGNYALTEGGREQAADVILAEIDRVLAITNAPW